MSTQKKPSSSSALTFVALIVLCCSPAFFLVGLGWTRNLITSITDEPGSVSMVFGLACLHAAAMVLFIFALAACSHRARAEHVNESQERHLAPQASGRSSKARFKHSTATPQSVADEVQTLPPRATLTTIRARPSVYAHDAPIIDESVRSLAPGTINT